MEALLATIVLFLLMGAALVVLARGWPRTSRLGGYRARTRDRGGPPSAADEERGRVNHEDDDTHWNWR